MAHYCLMIIFLFIIRPPPEINRSNRLRNPFPTRVNITGEIGSAVIFHNICKGFIIGFIIEGTVVPCKFTEYLPGEAVFPECR